MLVENVRVHRDFATEVLLKPKASGRQGQREATLKANDGAGRRERIADIHYKTLTTLPAPSPLPLFAPPLYIFTHLTFLLIFLRRRTDGPTGGRSRRTTEQRSFGVSRRQRRARFLLLSATPANSNCRSDGRTDLGGRAFPLAPSLHSSAHRVQQTSSVQQEQREVRADRQSDRLNSAPSVLSLSHSGPLGIHLFP